MPNLVERVFWNAFVLWHARDESRLPFGERAKILEIQNRRVRAIIEHAYATVPFYRDAMDARHLRPADFQSAEDLAKLPVLTSEQVARAPAQFLSRRFVDGATLRLDSSGTSGFQKPVYYDHAALMLALASGHRQRIVLARFVGKTLGYREMSVGRLDGTNSRLRRFYEDYSIIPRRLDFARTFVEPSGTVEDVVAKINQSTPVVLRGYGSYLGLIFRQAHNQQLPLVKPNVVLYGGDAMSEADRRLIEEEYGVPVLSSYQAVEALRLAFQCERREGFHIDLDQVAVRVIDENGEPVPEDKPGRIVISNLTNRATVLLNYMLGDIVTYTNRPCACGRTLPMLTNIHGRANDCVVLADGRIIHSLIVMPPLQTVAHVNRLQIVQTEPTHFLIRVVCSANVDWTMMRAELETRARAILGNAITLDVLQVDAIAPDASGKVRAVISHCLK
jgi:phenylacetate-CoA ligase